MGRGDGLCCEIANRASASAKAPADRSRGKRGKGVKDQGVRALATRNPPRT